MKKQFVKNYEGLSVRLIDKYAVVKETLERIGIVNENNKKFFPSCYIIRESDDKCKIYHFKQLLAKDGLEVNYDIIDEVRLKTVIHFLDKWGLVSAIDPIDQILENKIDVIPYKNKKDYTIVHKYMFFKNNEK
jgi:hypothetical protein